VAADPGQVSWIMNVPGVRLPRAAPPGETAGWPIPGRDRAVRRRAAALLRQPAGRPSDVSSLGT